MADIPALCSLGIASWQQYEQQLLPEYWQQLKESVYNEQTYIGLLNTAQCIVCTTDEGRGAPFFTEAIRVISYPFRIRHDRAAIAGVFTGQRRLPRYQNHEGTGPRYERSI